jgi:diguanylate cyclase (GGDEF)-like protein/PAS domain S-box-containing protein
MNSDSVIQAPQATTGQMQSSPETEQESNVDHAVALAQPHLVKLARVTSELDQVSSAFAAQTARFEAAMDHMKLAFYLFDDQGRLAVANERLRRLLGLNQSELKAGVTVSEFVNKLLNNLGALATGHTRIEAFLANTKSKEKSSLNLVFQSGQVLQVTHSPVRDGGFVQTLEDVTERRKAEARAHHLASHDVLTNLPNRRLLKQHIDVALNDSLADCAVLCVAVDRFKSVNNTLGHAGGDALLVEIAKRLGLCVRQGDIVGRLGGNEFIVLAANVKGREEIAALAQFVVSEIAKPFDILGQSVIVGASVGVAMAPNDGDTPDRLIKCADMALFEAKRAGRGGFHFFEATLETKARERQSLEIDLRRAVNNNEFELHYQPVFAARQRKLIGFEALVRWNHPTRGRVSPLDFIPVAEELGLITQLGDWIINDACRTAATWPNELTVAVNVSARQFINHDLYAVVTRALQEHGLPPHRLEIEVTESELMESGGEISSILQRLRSQGIGIAMDDFGTGYSSLAYLRRFHFTKVKIDRSFINGLATDDQSIAIVRAIIALCKSLNLVVTAEGVETELQADILRLENCDYLQGFLLGKPAPTNQLSEFFAQ